MDIRAEKIAKARQKLKYHQEKKIIDVQKEECITKSVPIPETQNNPVTVITHHEVSVNQDQLGINENEFSRETNEDIEKRSDINITEILISTKTNLESQIKNLTEKLTHLETLYNSETFNHNIARQKLVALENELKILSNKYEFAIQDSTHKDGSLLEMSNLISTLRDENNNLVEQLEFTKSMLTTKGIENTQLHNKISYCQNQLDVLQLQIQQLTNNTNTPTEQTHNNSEEREAYVKKISILEQTIETLQKERDQINCHYEHYVRELNEQYRSEAQKNETLAQEIQNLYNRENSLIEQISDMEIRLQNYKIIYEDNSTKQEDKTELHKKNQETQVELMKVNAEFKELEKQYMDSLAKIEELNKVKETECNHANISIDKLNADITSDKIAAQRATEQNIKLKLDVEGLEQVIIKLGNDKLELTEMWTHEKQLNKGLAIKLAEVEENVKNMFKQLKAKDGEMIRLQNENRDLERKYESVIGKFNQLQEQDVTEKVHNHDDTACHSHNHDPTTCHSHNHDLTTYHSHNHDDTTCHSHNHNHNSKHEEILINTPETKSLIETKLSVANLNAHNDVIPKQDAMSKLQERFLNIMDQVANLSDEKHRLEHIILQLQNETDTICEYVALYQQQRSLLKKREEERSNQLKIYQTECNTLKRHLEELRDLLLKFAGDHEIESYFKEDQRRNDLSRVKELLEELQNCSLINPNFKNFDLNIFYPCSCCSGQIIEI